MTPVDRRFFALIGVACIAFAAGSTLFVTMIVLFVPNALPFFVPYLPVLVGVPLIAGGATLTLLREW